MSVTFLTNEDKVVLDEGIRRNAEGIAKNAGDITTLTKDTAPAIIPTATGVMISISDSAERPLVAMRLFGKTTQSGTPAPSTPALLTSVGAGGKITACVEYVGYIPANTPNGLPGIPVSSGGNYMDANGQEWLCDEVDFGRGVYVQRIARYTLDGSVPPTGYNDIYGHMRFEWTGDEYNVYPLDYTRIDLQICNCFTPNTAALQLNDVDGVISTYETGGIFIRYDGAASAEAMTAYLASNPVEYMYAMQTPVETPLSDDEMDAFHAVSTLYPNTLVHNDAGAFMAVSYIADTNTYTNNKIAENGGSGDGGIAVETDPTVPAWAKQPTKPTYTAQEVGADPAGTAASTVSAHNVDVDAHNDIRDILQDLSDRVNAVLDSDDTTLDELSEIVAYIKSNKSLIDAITTSKVGVSDIIDNLTTNVSDKPLSAAQGVSLKALIDAITVPTKLSDLAEDTTHRVVTDAEKSAWNAKSTFSGAYADLTGKPTIPTVPTKVSAFENDAGYLTDHQDISGLLSRTELDMAIDTALAEAKESGEFDGEPGTSVTVASVSESAADGGSNVVTFSDGKTLNVKNGSKGSPGVDGYTPVKGVDYYTEADKAEFSEYIASELAKRGQLKPEFANSVEECTDTSLLYVLPDGYIYAYMLEEVTVPGGPNYNNVADPKSADWCANSRLGSSGVSEETNGSVVTNYVPCKKDDIIRVEGLNIGYLASNANARMHYLDANKSLLGSIYPISNRTGAFVPYEYGVLGDYVSYKWDYKVGSTGDGSTYESFADNIAFVRFCGKLETDAEHVVITVNEEIATSEPTTKKEYKWANTGHAFVPTNYEDRIISLENETNDLNDRLSDIEENGLETGDAIPEYWVNAANVAVEKIKSKQNLAGHSCVSFIDFSDMHIIHGANNYAHNVGKLARYLMDKCDIPLAIFLGDWVNGTGESTKELALDDVRVAKEILAPISSEELCTITGNHDLWFDGNTHTVSMEERYNAICRHNTKDFRKVFGESGSYYYVDNVPQKTRFIFLDGNWSEFTVDESGTPSYSAFAQGGYGQEQLQFLADSLKVENGWSVCIFTHVPPIAEYRPPATTPDYFRDADILIGIINAYADKTTYSGEYNGTDYNGYVHDWAKVSISVDYAAYNGELIAMFTGHRHLDEVFTEPLKCPIVTVTTCGGQKLKDGYDRTYGTDTETSLDVVTINKKTRMIYCTRVGAGADREINY